MHDLAGQPEHRETLNQMREQLLTHLRSTQVNSPKATNRKSSACARPKPRRNKP